MSPRFQPDHKANPESMLIDPEAYDASEQQFAASLDVSRPKFIVEPENPAGAAQNELGYSAPMISEMQGQPPLIEGDPSASTATADPAPDPNAWRNEVSARLDRYRSKRRTKEPRYPSLRLKFEPSESASEPDWTGSPAVTAPVLEPEQPAERAIEVRFASLPAPAFSEPAARIIPFRRSALAPPRPLDELAEPVFLAPRILEAEESVQAPPALGGILIEPVEEVAAEKRPGLELPIQPAAMSQRLLAVATDVLLVGIAVALFGYIFFRTTAIIPPISQIAIISLALAAFLWPAYQYALLVYSGATPGLKLAKLQLARFDGSAVPRRLRGWRVMATALSGISLGLGYAWCILDEDQLCWHDRITGTYMAPKGSN